MSRKITNIKTRIAAAVAQRALKLIHMFSINPYLGPLQISLGRMVIDIIKFFFIYTLVLFAFACGLNQLLWYYSDMERHKCYSLPGGEANWEKQRDSCLAWRRFSNLFESSQSLFWASFGLVDLSNFELTGIKSYTRFWGLLMFGSYSVINVVVLLNLLIAMMSNSYQVISERADVEWKFARTKLFMAYFDKGGIVPPPFNIIPSMKCLLRMFTKETPSRKISIRRKETTERDRDHRYQDVMRNLVWRYVTAQQRNFEMHGVTEDDINELRQDVSSFRYELMDVLRENGMDTSSVKIDRTEAAGKKTKIRERRLLKDFSIGMVEVCTGDIPDVKESKNALARLVGLTTGEGPSQRWRDLIKAAQRSVVKEPASRTNSLRQNLMKQVNINTEITDSAPKHDQQTLQNKPPEGDLSAKHWLSPPNVSSTGDDEQKTGSSGTVQAISRRVEKADRNTLPKNLFSSSDNLRVSPDSGARSVPSSLQRRRGENKDQNCNIQILDASKLVKFTLPDEPRAKNTDSLVLSADQNKEAKSASPPKASASALCDRGATSLLGSTTQSTETTVDISEFKENESEKDGHLAITTDLISFSSLPALNNENIDSTQFSTSPLSEVPVKEQTVTASADSSSSAVTNTPDITIDRSFTKSQISCNTSASLVSPARPSNISTDSSASKTKTKMQSPQKMALLSPATDEHDISHGETNSCSSSPDSGRKLLLPCPTKIQGVTTIKRQPRFGWI